MSAAETEEEAPPPQKKSIFACLTNLPGVCVPQKGAEPNADEPTPKSKSRPKRADVHWRDSALAIGK
mgnify:CR=1 FL=1